MSEAHADCKLFHFSRDTRAIRDRTARRDAFAAAALGALIGVACDKNYQWHATGDEMAAEAVKYADALLAALDATEGR